MDRGTWWAAVHGVPKSRTRLSNLTFTFHFHALETEMATHSSVLAWRIPGTGEPGRLLSMGSHRVGHDWSDLAAAWWPWDSIWQTNYRACDWPKGFSCHVLKFAAEFPHLHTSHAPLPPHDLVEAGSWETLNQSTGQGLLLDSPAARNLQASHNILGHFCPSPFSLSLSKSYITSAHSPSHPPTPYVLPQVFPHR